MENSKLVLLPLGSSLANRHRFFLKGCRISSKDVLEDVSEIGLVEETGLVRESVT